MLQCREFFIANFKIEISSIILDPMDYENVKIFLRKLLNIFDITTIQDNIAQFKSLLLLYVRNITFSSSIFNDKQNTYCKLYTRIVIYDFQLNAK